MAKGLSRTQQRHILGVLDTLGRIRDRADKFTEDEITDVYRRDGAGSIVPDGFPITTSQERVKSSGSSSSTETAAIQRSDPEHRGQRDTVREHRQAIERLLREAESRLIDAAGRIKLIRHQETEHRGRQAGGDPCLVGRIPENRGGNPCGNGADKRGVCHNHYNSWIRYGRPDLQLWVMWVGEARSSDDLLLVPECPPPSPGMTVLRGPFKNKEGDYEDDPNEGGGPVNA